MLFGECSRLYCVPVEKVYEIFMGITLWIDKAGNKIIPVSDILRGYSYFYPRTIKKTAIANTTAEIATLTIVFRNDLEFNQEFPQLGV